MHVRTILLPLAVPIFAVLGGVLSAHTAGIVVPPSNAGQAEVAVATHLAAPHIATHLAAPHMATDVDSPTDLVITNTDPSDGGLILSATLTSLGNPLVDEIIEFYLGTAQTGTLLCIADTSSKGAAICDANGGQAIGVDGQGYSAAFEGDRTLAAATTTWPRTTP